MTRILIILWVTLLLVFMLTACAADVQETVAELPEITSTIPPSPEPTNTATPTLTSTPEPTTTPESTATPLATSTSLPAVVPPAGREFIQCKTGIRAQVHLPVGTALEELEEIVDQRCYNKNTDWQTGVWGHIVSQTDGIPKDDAGNEISYAFIPNTSCDLSEPYYCEGYELWVPKQVFDIVLDPAPPFVVPPFVEGEAFTAACTHDYGGRGIPILDENPSYTATLDSSPITIDEEMPLTNLLPWLHECYSELAVVPGHTHPDLIYYGNRRFTTENAVFSHLFRQESASGEPGAYYADDAAMVRPGIYDLYLIYIAPTNLNPDTLPPPTPAPLVLQRPVDSNIPLYHGYGYIGGSYNGFHPGYDYGFNTCDPIGEPVLAMAPGKVTETWVDVPHPSGKNGGLLIDNGFQVLADGRISHVFSQFGHVIPLVPVGTIVEANSHVADFSTCERYGYTPELEIQILVEEDKGVLTHIDPLLVGLKPQ